MKTSTGFGPGGATAADVALMRRVVGEEMGVKAAGGVKDLDALLEKVKKGPPGSRVDNVKESDADPKEKLADHFQIRDSAAPPK